MQPRTGSRRTSDWSGSGDRTVRRRLGRLPPLRSHPSPLAAISRSSAMISAVIAESAAVERPQRAGLVWSEHGAVDGKPVVFFHGWPSSRMLGSAWQSAAARRGWRVITPDRPGLGKSPPQPGRRFGDWPATLEALLDELGIERCPVIGMSGGGPYALVSAARLPGRVAAAVVISGAPPLDDVNDHRLIRPWFRTLAWTKRHWPGPMRLGFRLAGQVVRRMNMTTARRFARTTLPAADAAFFRTTAGDATLACRPRSMEQRRPGRA